ncbi:MAG TPA: hypothetical protein PKW82_11780, partial [Spirochaetales bacterium]|nr:hypothetical protein [Spirochaetales bacterium]
MKAIQAALGAAFILIVSGSCAPSNVDAPGRAAPGAAGLSVAVTVPPQAYFARRVAGDRAVILTV